MIIRDKPSAWQLLLPLRGSVVQHIWPQIAIATLFAVAVKYFYNLGSVHLASITMEPFAVFGIAHSR